MQRVEDELAGAPLIQSGARHQPVSNPMIRTLVELQAHFVMLLQALQVPLGEEGDPEQMETSRLARRAAMMRWHGRTG
jgi:hypothetical protein